MRNLAEWCVAGSVAEELLAFDNGRAVPFEGITERCFPLAPEPHVACWESYADEAKSYGAWVVLSLRLPQLQFPIRKGISQSETYRNAVRRGIRTAAPNEESRLKLAAPDQLRLWLHPSLAGPLPVLCTSLRSDFVQLVQALSARNEPVPVPDSMGACLVTGLNNWDRVRQHREQWELERLGTPAIADWEKEFRRLVSRKELYQDRLAILCEGPYSNVPAVALGLSEEAWATLSLDLRLAHECAHYLMLRLTGTLRSRPLDELVSDYAALAAEGGYRADWALRLLGLDADGRYRPGGRLENYLGRPSLSEDAFAVVCRLVKAAVEFLDCWDRQRRFQERSVREQVLLLAVLFGSTLEELAGPEAETLIKTRLGWLGSQVRLKL